MRIRSAYFSLFLVLLLALGTIAPAQEKVKPQDEKKSPELYKLDPGPHKVKIQNLEWRDEKRLRDIPVRIYSPETGDGPWPLILFSHGLGGSREGASYLGNHLASHGYVCVHLQHAGSDNSIWKGKNLVEAEAAMQQATKNPRNAANRTQDVTFAIDQIQAMNADSESDLHEKIDLDHIGMSGHSFGAHTTLSAIGQAAVLPSGRKMAFAEKRITAAIAYSPAPPRHGKYREAFEDIRIPCFHMTGTKDYSAISDVQPEQRRIPFDHMAGADQYLVIFRDGEHSIFSDERPRGKKHDPMYHRYIKAASTAFWDAYLKNEAEAKEWLTSADGFEKSLNANGTFEKKLKSADE
ncbi:MAG: alpha/beta hydrolase family protein [bacterium]